jgi:outer membrane murein-binding lipoprotein Lpp
MIKEIRKSIILTITVLAGTINLGKYTLVNKLELAIREFAASLKALEKNCQGNIPAQTIMA